jgi:multimeric flavodoxin WrbA
MKKNDVLIILSSPRKKSNSAFAAIKLSKKLNATASVININEFNIKPCRACFNCSKNYKCCIKDDFEKIMNFVNEAKIIIVASPVYFTGVPGQFKNFIDRNQQQWEKYRKGFLKKHPKTGYIILTAGAYKRKYFKPAESEIKSFFAVNNVKCQNIFRFGNMDEPGKIKKEQYIKKLKI